MNALEVPGSYTPFIITIFSHKVYSERRRRQRSAFLNHSWQTNKDWRYIYVLGDGDGLIYGDKLKLDVPDSYENLVFKTTSLFKWVLTNVDFGHLLKTDDDSIVHVDRAARWLAASNATQPLYAGRVATASQVIRPNFTRLDLLNPRWYPKDFGKWTVPFDTLDNAEIIHGRYYPPYCTGGGYFLSALAARLVLKAHTDRVLIFHALRVEDAYVGLLAWRAGVVATSLNNMIVDDHLQQTRATFYRKMIVHRVGNQRRALGWITYNDEPSS
jgi:hypothetical protein